MNTQFERYKSRKINCIKTLAIETCYIKVYTISNRPKFESIETLESVFKVIPNWLKDINNSNLPTHNHAFLIVHEAREGVLILLNWWTGGEMLETKIYFAAYKDPTIIVPSIFDTKALVCIWELEIFFHERKAWIKHILKKPDNPDFKTYQQDYLIQ